MSINTGTLLGPEPLAIAISFWAINPGGVAAFEITVFAAVFTSLSLLVAAAIARRTSRPRREQGAWALCAALSNQGATFGTFVLFSAWGERGFVLGTLYAVHFMPVLTTLGFQQARSFSEEQGARGLAMLTQVFLDRRSRNPLLGVLIGVALQVWGPPRPALLGAFNQLLIPLNTFLYLRPGAIRRHARDIWIISGIKFVLMPAFAYLAALALGFGAIPDHEFLRVVVIQNSTPVAIMAVVTASIFRLDQELANSAWIVTNFGAVALVPWLTFLATHL